MKLEVEVSALRLLFPSVNGPEPLPDQETCYWKPQQLKQSSYCWVAVYTYCLYI